MEIAATQIMLRDTHLISEEEKEITEELSRVLQKGANEIHKLKEKIEILNEEREEEQHRIEHVTDSNSILTETLTEQWSVNLELEHIQSKLKQENEQHKSCASLLRNECLTEDPNVTSVLHQWKTRATRYQREAEKLREKLENKRERIKKLKEEVRELQGQLNSYKTPDLTPLVDKFKELSNASRPKVKS